MNTVLESIKQAKIYSHPWPHYEINNIFNGEICNWITNFDYPSNDEILNREKNWFLTGKAERVGAVGFKSFLQNYKERFHAAQQAVWHKKTHPCEFIFGSDFLQKYSQAQRIVDMFLDRDVIALLESLENIKLTNTFLRVMLIKDIHGYHIPVHPDTNRKLFTLQCFFKTDINEGKELGTQLCNENGDIVKRTSYVENGGTFFFPCQEKKGDRTPTLHAFIDTPIDEYRISMMVNYCTREEVIKDDVGNKLGYLIPVSE